MASTPQRLRNWATMVGAGDPVDPNMLSGLMAYAANRWQEAEAEAKRLREELAALERLEVDRLEYLEAGDPPCTCK